jgi:hypothetical protein
MNSEIMQGNNSGLIKCRIGIVSDRLKTTLKTVKKTQYLKRNFLLWTTEYSKETHYKHAQDTQRFNIYMIDQSLSQFLWHRAVTECHKDGQIVLKH